MSLRPPPHPMMTIRNNATFILLLRIRDSLDELLDRKLRECCTTGSKNPELDQAIRYKMRDLGNNALYVAGTGVDFRQDMNKRLESMGLWDEPLHRDNGVFFVEKIRCKMDALVDIIERQIEENGEMARLGSLALAPFLEEKKEKE